MAEKRSAQAVFKSFKCLPGFFQQYISEHCQCMGNTYDGKIWLDLTQLIDIIDNINNFKSDIQSVFSFIFYLLKNLSLENTEFFFL